MRLATSAQMRTMDRVTIEQRGVPSALLMERAAAALAAEAEKMLPAGAGAVKRAAVFCGAGNNGGDGVAAARLLRAAGWQVDACLVGQREKMSADCAEMERRLIAGGGKLISFTENFAEMERCAMAADVIVDALFGIGLNAAIRGAGAEAVALMNRAPAPVLSADIASGISADTGEAFGDAVFADRTVTFTLPKAGHFVGDGALHSGTVVVAGIGIPQELVDGEDYPVRVTEPDEIRLPRRARDSHKGDYGRVYILGGSTGYAGAPVLAASAAARTGAGLITVGTPRAVWGIVAGKLLEPMPHPLPDNGAGQVVTAALEPVLAHLGHSDACLVGPGLGRGEETAVLVRRLLAQGNIPVVLDADGINALEGHIDVLDGRRDSLTVLTPHDGEFARLTGAPPGKDRLGAARAFARAHGCVLVLKGFRTVTAFPDGTAAVNTTGNPGMATGGSGDVLAGIILSLLGQGIPPAQAVPAAVYLHGKAGDSCARVLGEYGMLPSDIIRRLPFELISE
ncbi:MAG: NAD(P)H-hydrate dehydratase [Oscillospiraceae bacterium]|nr:NAD(P)H-hydrate dehydratase [Oscillospiraceae bacterium]